MSSAPGKFITFEGGEGSGKTTQISLLQTYLEGRGIPVLRTREPGGTPDAEAIRALLLTGSPCRFDPMTELLLMFASRRDHLVKKIWPALAAGTWVLCDRFADSSMAYQGYGQGLDHGVIQGMYDLVVGDFNPDLTFVLDLDPALGLARAKPRNDATTNEDRFERMGDVFHQKIRQAFLDIAAQNPHRCIVLDAGGTVETLHGQLIAQLEVMIHGAA